jgi:uncharacterized protein YlxW (UPF0749 family)
MIAKPRKYLHNKRKEDIMKLKKLSQKELIEIADEIETLEKFISNSHNQHEISHAQDRIEQLCLLVPFWQIADLDNILMARLADK